MPKTPIRLHFDNKLANYIIQNLVFYERMKYIEVNCHVIQSKYGAGIIEPKLIFSVNQLAHLLTRPLRRSQMQFIFNKLGMYDVYAPS